jgi:CubicO group peptidase (beta-lactamase class C family)
MKKLILFLLFSPHLFCQNKPDSLENKVDAIFQKFNNLKGPGCAVAIIRNGTVIFRKGYGLANLEYEIPIGPATNFDIASVSKQFTGMAISTLIQQGKISLDDDIHKWLPDVPQFGKLITIRHLLHHISGIRDWPQTLNAAGWRWDETFSFQDIMRMVKYQKDLDFEPGTKFSYSNTGYNLLAAIAEKAVTTFREWTDSVIFKPLGMIPRIFLMTRHHH